MEKLKKEETENPEAASTEQDGSLADDACAQTETADPQTETADDNTSSAATDEQDDAATDGDSEADKVQELGQKLVEVQDRYTRLYAEFENYRRRTGAEKIELQLSGHREMAKAILPVLDDLERDVPVGIISLRFHDAIVGAIVAIAELARAMYGISLVVLSGGCFMNRYLAEQASARLRQAGFTVALNAGLPPNDGCVSYGQAVVAAASR